MRRLLLVQLLVALLTAAETIWFLNTAWLPSIEKAISRLPSEGELRFGVLDWKGASPVILAEGPFLAIAVDMNLTGEGQAAADLQVEFGRTACRFTSFLGILQSPYPGSWLLPFNRTVLEPWWGAWKPAVLAGAAALVVIALLVSWSMLAAVYWLPVWLAGFISNREMTGRGSFRLAGAALMPGAVFMIAGIFAYGIGVIDLMRLAAAFGAHFVIGWLYLLLALLKLPRHPEATGRGNPFGVS